MYLLPLLLSNMWGDLGQAPHTTPNFGIRPQELMFPSVADSYYPKWNDGLVLDFYYRPWMNLLNHNNDGGIATITSENDKLTITINVRHFKPEEVKVKVVGRYIVVEAKHEEKKDEQGTILRQFIRRYLLPDRADIDQVSSTISSDGILTITAPLKKEEEPEERVITIEQSGKPAFSDETGEKDSTTPTEKKVEENEVREELTTHAPEEETKPEK